MPDPVSETPDIPSAGELDAAGVEAAALIVHRGRCAYRDDLCPHVGGAGTLIWDDEIKTTRAAITAYLTTAPRSVPGVGEGEALTETEIARCEAIAEAMQEQADRYIKWVAALRATPTPPEHSDEGAGE